MIEYNDDIDEDADIIIVKDFREACECGAFVDYDGMGSPVKNDKCNSKAEYWIYPSTLVIPSDATHVVWYNR